MRRFACLLLVLLPALAAAENMKVTITPTTQYVNGDPLPATGPGALLSHRVEVGSCSGTSGADFGTVLQSKVIAMPQVEALFTGLPFTVLCVRAYATNQFGDSEPYPTIVAGPRPGNSGSILLINRTGP